MGAKFRNLILAVFSTLSIVLSACGPTSVSQPIFSPALTDTQMPMLTSIATSTLSTSLTDISTPTAAVTLPSSPTAIPLSSYAQNLTLTTDDLGDGWVLDAEKTDLNASYYADRGDDGKAIIGTHRNTNKTIFDPPLIESVSMRGFSQSDQNLVLFLIVAVFKETSRAEEFVKEYLPNAGRDSDIPDENYTYQDVVIGDESSLVSVWETPGETPPVASNLSFRKGRVWVELISVGQWDDLSNSPPVSEERLEELARIVEARIP